MLNRDSLPENHKITINDIKKIIDKLLKATHILAESHPNADKDKHYIRVIEGIYRRNTFTFLSIRYLANHMALADSAGVLERKMIEDVITVEYILLNGKEKMAKRFQDFFYIQAMQEIELYIRLGYSNLPRLVDMETLGKRVEGLKSQFWHAKTNQFMRSWSGKSAEQMLIDLAKAKVFSKHEINSILLGYTRGSWKNHPNPIDTLTYMTNDLRKQSSQSSLIQATILSIFSFIRLTTRYIDEIREIQHKNVYEDVNKVVKEVFGYLSDKNISIDEDG
jgi:hypothetical protein